MDKVVHWLREKTGFYMLNAHLDGIYGRLKQQDEKIQELEQENEILKEKLQISQNSDKKTIEIIRENERLKEELRTEKIYSSQIEELEENLQHAKAENKELSESIKRLKKLKFKSDGIELLQDANLHLHNANVKYRQALQEIKDIILSPEIIDEETKKLHTSEELDNIVRWHREDKLSKIETKINEVIGAE